MWVRLLRLRSARPFQPPVRPPEPRLWGEPEASPRLPLCQHRRGSKPCASGGLCPSATTGVRGCLRAFPAACTTQPASGQARPRGGAATGGQGRWLWELSFIGLGHVSGQESRGGCGDRVGGWRHCCLQAPQKVLQCTSALSTAMGAPAPFPAGTPAPQHRPWWPGPRPPLPPQPVCREERLRGLPPLFAAVPRPPLNHWCHPPTAV